MEFKEREHCGCEHAYARILAGNEVVGLIETCVCSCCEEVREKNVFVKVSNGLASELDELDFESEREHLLGMIDEVALITPTSRAHAERIASDIACLAEAVGDIILENYDKSEM